MIDAVVSRCLERRGVVWAVCLLVALYGAFSWTQLPLEAYPDIADTTSQVVTQVPGLAAEEVETRITIPLEQAIMGTPGMAVMRSKSTFGLSLITVVFQDGTGDYPSRQRLLERIAGLGLPYGAQPGLDPLTSPIGEIYRYTLESKTRDLRERSELQRWTVIPRLKQVPGLADVANFGGLTTQFQIELDPSRLSAHGVSLAQVTQAIAANNDSAGGSVMSRGDQGFVIRAVGLIGGLADLSNIVVAAKGGVPVLLGDLGRVGLGQQERHGILGKNGDPDGIEGIALLLKGENPSRVLAGVHQAVRELNEQLLPKDVQIVPYLDRSTLVEATVHTVGHTLLEGMGLVTLVLLLFLGSARAALIVALTIPLSLLTAFILMHQFNIPANLLSLGAIDFGIVVDAAIVVMENILRRREDEAGRPLGADAVRQATLQVTRPIFFGMVVIITAYAPLLAFQRIEYKLFAPMAYAVGFALLGALAVGLTVVPGLALLAYRRPRKVFHNPVLEGPGRLYAAVLERVVGRRGLTATAFGLALAGVLALGSLVGRDFLPYLDEGSLWLQVTLPPGLSLEKATRMADALRRATLAVPEVATVVTQLGRNDDGTDPFTPSHIEASVTLQPPSQWTPGWTKQDLIRRLGARYAELPGTEVGFSQPMIDGVLDKLAGAHSDLVLKVYGRDFEQTRRVAGELVAILKAVPGAADVVIDQEPPLPQLRIDVDRAAAARHGINVADVTALVGTGIGGAPVSQLYLEERRYDIVARYPPGLRDDPATIGRLLLTAPSGERVPLADVARIGLAMGESTITREMGRRHLTVRLDLRGRDLASFLAEARRKIETGLRQDPSRVQLAWGGQFENQNRAEARLLLILPMVLALMFLLLYAQFRNLWQPAMILLAVPLAALGGLVALVLRGMTLNVSSAVGFIALFGVAVMNGIIMVSHLNRLHEDEGLPLREAVIRGARERFRPVLMTATVAALGMLPAALATGLGSDVQRPLATVVVGGLVTATGLTLVWLPALYHLLRSRIDRPGRRPQAGGGLAPAADDGAA